MNKTAAAIAAIVTAGAVALWTIGTPRIGAPSGGGERAGLIVGTGVVTGVNYPAGGAVCRLVNRGRDAHGLRCLVESTAGSVHNVNALRSGEIDLAIVQSDWQEQAVAGSGSFKAVGPYDDLRALFSLHAETFNVIVRRDSGIRQFADLKGKRVNVGAPGTGQRAVVEDLLAAFGWTLKDFAQAGEARVAEQAKALCDKRVDALLFVAAHPNGAVQEALGACDAALIDVVGVELGRLLTEAPRYAAATLPAGVYERQGAEVRSFGLKATLVAAAALDDEAAYQVVKAVFDNFDEFRALHPAFAGLDARTLARDGNAAPLHPGAERYFREKGLL